MFDIEPPHLQTSSLNVTQFIQNQTSMVMEQACHMTVLNEQEK
jgi:hypothetical protein